MARRPLPVACYDFFVRDSRDGERWGPYDTPRSARTQRDFLRAYVESYQRACFSVLRRISAAKVSRLLGEK